MVDNLKTMTAFDKSMKAVDHKKDNMKCHFFSDGGCSTKRENKK